MTEEVQVIPVSSALESIERAQIDVQIATAKRYPRDLKKVKDGMLSLATLDQETAAACFYRLPRGGKSIMGPSVRLAEIAVSQYGNVRVQTRIIETDVRGESPHVTVQSVCADLEKNVAVSIEKRRRIVGKKLYEDGKPAGNKPPDEDDINLAANACGAIAFRDAVFKVIPGVLVKPAFDAARKAATGDVKTLSQRRLSAVEAFGKMGVDVKRVLGAVKRTSIDQVTLDDLEELLGLFSAIKDGEITIDAAFPDPQAAEPEAGTEAPPNGKRIPTLRDAKPEAPPATSEPATPPATEPEPPEREPGADEDDLPYDGPKENPNPEPEKPAVKGGVTGATTPLGGRPKRTLAHPE